MSTPYKNIPPPEAWLLLSAIKLAQTARSLDERFADDKSPPADPNAAEYPPHSGEALGFGDRNGATDPNSPDRHRSDPTDSNSVTGPSPSEDTSVFEELERDARRYLDLIDRLATIGQHPQGEQLLQELAEAVNRQSNA